MENDITFLQMEQDYRRLLRFYLTLKEIQSLSGVKELAKKKLIEFQQEQVDEEQSFTPLWNLISIMRKDF